MNSKQHWETVYSTKSDREVGWFQENPNTSLKLILDYTYDKNQPFIDVGGGNSYLSKILFEIGFTNITVLDISGRALERSRNRLGYDGKKIKWIEADVTNFSSDTLYQLWHDRAVFHFLINDDEIKQYAKVAGRQIAKGGFLILGAFSLSGPTSCSGLTITQYSEEKLTNVFAGDFELINCFENVHTTPSGNKQNFIWVVFRKN